MQIPPVESLADYVEHKLPQNRDLSELAHKNAARQWRGI
jgi:hypothetical protein